MIPLLVLVLVRCRTKVGIHLLCGSIIGYARGLVD